MVKALGESKDIPREGQRRRVVLTRSFLQTMSCLNQAGIAQFRYGVGQFGLMSCLR